MSQLKSHQMAPLTTLGQIKSKARYLARHQGEKSYMQYLDQVSREQLGVRHYHEARIRLQKRQANRLPSNAMTFYLSFWQEYYLDI